MHNKELIIRIEIPQGSSIKYEYDRKLDAIIVDRILREGFIYPANYGFIPKTIDWDGDELDVLVFNEEKFVTGTYAKVRIVGAMKMIDDGETDTKLIAVHADDYRQKNISDISQIPKEWLEKVKIFFSTYKNWKHEGITSVSGFENEKYALNEIVETQNLYKKYSNLDKKEFIKKMMKEHPEKYKI
ncbi:MAG: inorganic diphosphatase [Mollicutes bacterium PWAP]|nr:inorganic diphosphatase [Mollicutes bacterium PWAP]